MRSFINEHGVTSYIFDEYSHPMGLYYKGKKTEEVKQVAEVKKAEPAKVVEVKKVEPAKIVKHKK